MAASVSVSVSGITDYHVHYDPYSIRHWGDSEIPWDLVYQVPNGKRILIDQNGGSTKSGVFTPTDGRTGNVAIAASFADGQISSSNNYIFAPTYTKAIFTDAWAGVVDSHFYSEISDGKWWGLLEGPDNVPSGAGPDYEVSASVNFNLSNTTVQRELPAGFTFEQFFEVREENTVLGYGLSPCTQNEVYWVIKEPAGKYITGYTVYYQGGGSATFNDGYGGPYGRVGNALGAVGTTSNVITKIVFTAAAGYRVRVKFTGTGDNGACTIDGASVREKAFQGGEKVVVQLDATEPSRIYGAQAKVYTSTSSSPGTYSLPGRYGGSPNYLATCTSVSAGSSRYRQIVCTIAAIDRDYEFEVPLETLYSLTVTDSSAGTVIQGGHTRAVKYVKGETSSSYTAMPSYKYITFSRIAKPGEEVTVYAKTGDNDSYIYQILDSGGNVLATNTAKAGDLSVPLVFASANISVAIVARLKVLPVTTVISADLDTGLANVAAAYPGIDGCQLNGAGNYDYGDEISLYPVPAQGFLFFGLHLSYATTATGVNYLQTWEGNEIASPDPSQASPYTDEINQPRWYIAYFGPANLQIVVSADGDGTVEGGGAFLSGAAKQGASPVTLTATPGEYSAFDHWEYQYTRRHTYHYDASSSGVSHTRDYPAVSRLKVDENTAGQTSTLTLDPTKILDGVVEITAVFVLVNPGKLLYGSQGKLLHGASGTLLFVG